MERRFEAIYTNFRNYVTNECPGFEHLRNRTKRKLEGLIDKKIGADLEGKIIGGYFNTEYPYTLNTKDIGRREK